MNERDRKALDYLIACIAFVALVVLSVTYIQSRITGDAQSVRPGATCQPCKEPLPCITVIAPTSPPTATQRPTATPTPKPSATITPYPTWTPTALPTLAPGVDIALSVTNDTVRVGDSITLTLWYSDRVPFVEGVLYGNKNGFVSSGASLSDDVRCDEYSAVVLLGDPLITRLSCESKWIAIQGYKRIGYWRVQGITPGKYNFRASVFAGLQSGGRTTSTVEALVYVVP